MQNDPSQPGAFPQYPPPPQYPQYPQGAPQYPPEGAQYTPPPPPDGMPPQYGGYAPPPYPYYAGPVAAPTSGWAIASLVCSLLGVVGLLPLIGSILGAIFGHVALGEIGKSEGRIQGRGLAMAGLVIGYVSLALIALAIVFIIVVIIAASSSSTPINALPLHVG